MARCAEWWLDGPETYEQEGDTIEWPDDDEITCAVIEEGLQRSYNDTSSQV